MAKSGRVRLADVRGAYLLVGECRELGADPVAWQTHLLRGLGGIVNSVIGVAAELDRNGVPAEGDRWLRVASYLESGPPGETAIPPLRACARAGTWGGLPIFRATAGLAGPVATFTRRQVLDDSGWYGHDFIRQLVRDTGLDDLLASFAYSTPVDLFFVGLSRAHGDRPFGRRERRLLHLCAVEVGRLHGTRLTPGTGPSVARLAPRLRQVVLCLFDGDSEKQAAVRLGVAPATVHEYLRRLHRTFGVNTRGELLARCAPLLPVLRQQADESK